jgi:hypothetical protein
MNPHDPPVEVNPGGTFTFTGTLRNNTAGNIVGDVWVMVEGPGGGQVGPVMQFDDLPLGPYQQIVAANAAQEVPTWAPAGYYKYKSYAGFNPSWIADSAEFQFRVLGTVVGDADDWHLSGWFEENQDITPSGFVLIDNFPNPFNSSTEIRYTLPGNFNVRLDIYNILGQRVETLIDGYQHQGAHTVTWNAQRFSSSIYFCRLTAGEKVYTNRMTLLK